MKSLRATKATKKAQKKKELAEETRAEEGRDHNHQEWREQKWHENDCEWAEHSHIMPNHSSLLEPWSDHKKDCSSCSTCNHDPDQTDDYDGGHKVSKQHSKFCSETIMAHKTLFINTRGLLSLSTCDTYLHELSQLNYEFSYYKT